MIIYPPTDTDDLSTYNLPRLARSSADEAKLGKRCRGRARQNPISLVEETHCFPPFSFFFFFFLVGGLSLCRVSTVAALVDTLQMPHY